MKTKLNKKSKIDRDDIWLDLVNLYLSNGKLITVEDIELILDELSKNKINLTKIKLKDGSNIQEEDASLILRFLIKT